MDLVIGFDQWIWSLGGINGFGLWQGLMDLIIGFCQWI